MLRDWFREVRWTLQGFQLASSSRKDVHVWSVAGGLGDELMALGAVQAFAARRMGSVNFHVRIPALISPVQGNIEVAEYDRSKLPASGIALSYLARHRLPVIAQMCRQLGVRPAEFPISLPRRTQSELPSAFPTNGRRVVIQTTASDWTPNKQWPEAYWRHLLEILPDDVHVIEVGRESVFTTPPARAGYVSLVGNTSLLEFAACIQESEAFIGPVSGGMHLAHAYEVPSVIIIGGYEAPHPYPLATQFYTAVPCAPCWLRTPCPHDLRCLRQITPETVRESVLKVLAM